MLTVWQACADIDPATAKKLLIADLAAQDYFGISVSLSADGNTALIGAFYDNQKGTASGCAYIFVYADGSWIRQAKLSANDAVAVDFFGKSVSLSADGSAALIGAEGKDDWKGAAYIFTGAGSTWTQQAKLTAADGISHDMFGNAVSLSANGSLALIGAHGKDDWKGAAYLFAGSGNIWTEQKKLIAADGIADDMFGNAVSLSADGSTALIGADSDDDNGGNSGAAYIFTGVGSTWAQQAKLTSADGATNDRFCTSVSLSGNGRTALIGAYGKESYTGTAYIFAGSDNAWTQQAKLTDADSAAHDSFGVAVSLSADGSTALIGAAGKESSRGAAYIFTGSGNTWTQATKLTANNGAAGDSFGLSASLSPDGNTALIGVPFDTVHSSAYIFNSITTRNSSHAMPWMQLILQ